MTPFGEKMRALRKARGITQATLAKALTVSPAYLSALEHGKRGKPSFAFVQKIIQYYDLIWDDAENIWDLAQISAPRVTLDTAGLDPKATLVANRLAQKITYLNDDELTNLLAILDQ